MKTKNWRVVVALALCTLLPAMVAHAKDKVPRPLKMTAESQQVWLLDENGAPVDYISAEGWGVSTHCGLFYSAQSATVPAPEGFLGGFLMSANADQIFYIWPVGNPSDGTITGGTGRFLELRVNSS